MKTPKYIATLITCLAASALLASAAFAADINDLKDAYYGNHWSMNNPGLEPQPGLLTISGKVGNQFAAIMGSA